MSTKLTLSISDSVLIEEAKKYAKEHNQSLSKMIESYLESVIQKRKKGGRSKELKLSPEVQSLVGIMKCDKNFDYKKERDKMYDEKYKKYLNNTNG